MPDDKDGPAVVMLQPNKYFVATIIVCLVIAGYQMWAGKKEDGPKETGSVVPASPTPTVPPVAENPVPPSGGTGAVPPPSVEKPEPPKAKLELFKKVKVTENWSDAVLVELPDNTEFKIKYPEAEWYQVKFWNGEILPEVREGEPPPYWGDVPHSKFWIRGTKGTAEVWIERSGVKTSHVDERLELFKKVKVEEVKWSEEITLPPNREFLLHHAPADWLEIRCWNGDEKRFTSKENPNSWLGTISHSIFRIRGSPGVLEVWIER